MAMNTDNLHRNGRWHTPFLPCWKPEDGPHPRKRPRALCFEALLALMMLLMLACTAVQDPSGRWETSGMDPGLEGKWEDVTKGHGPEDGGDPTLLIWLFTKDKGGYYILTAPEAPPPSKEKERDPVIRTFAVNKKNFMLLVSPAAAEGGFDKVKEKEGNGSIWLYEVKDDTLHLFMLDANILDKAIAEGKIQGISRDAQKPPPPPLQDTALNNPSIATLDDATCAALAELTKDEKAWKEIGQFKRVKDEKKEEKPATK